MERLKFRQLKEDDYEKVLDIRKPWDVYGGRDYLPAYYKMFMKTKGHVGYAADIDGKLVSCEFGVCLDDGKTMCSRAARVSKEWEGQRIYKKLSQHVLQEFMQKFHIERKVVTFDNTNMKMVNQVKDGSFKLITQRDIHCYRSMIRHVRNNTKNVSKELQLTKTVTSDCLKKLFSSETDSCCLFRDNRVIVCWVPFRLLESNIPLILFGNSICVTSGLMKEAVSRRPLITFGQYYDTDMCLMYHVDVYGLEFGDLQHHLVDHLSRICAMNPDREIQLMMYVDKGSDIALFDRMLSRFGFSRLDAPMRTQMCAEKELKHSMAI